MWGSTETNLIIGVISKAIFKGNTLSFYWENGRKKGKSVLETEDNLYFSGEYAYKRKNTVVSGRVTAQLFKNPAGVLLFGHWVKSKKHFIWVAQLSQVLRFKDEVN